jgi:hypothetical protein
MIITEILIYQSPNDSIENDIYLNIVYYRHRYVETGHALSLQWKPATFFTMEAGKVFTIG